MTLGQERGGLILQRSRAHAHKVIGNENVIKVVFCAYFRQNHDGELNDNRLAR